MGRGHPQLLPGATLSSQPLAAARAWMVSMSLWAFPPSVLCRREQQLSSVRATPSQREHGPLCACSPQHGVSAPTQGNTHLLVPLQTESDCSFSPWLVVVLRERQHLVHHSEHSVWASESQFPVKQERLLCDLFVDGSDASTVSMAVDEENFCNPCWGFSDSRRTGWMGRGGGEVAGSCWTRGAFSKWNISKAPGAELCLEHL